MKRLAFYDAPEFFEPYTTAKGFDVKVHFYLPKDGETNQLVGKYVNALDFVVAMGYKDFYKAWATLKKKYKLEIECCFTSTVEDTVVMVEDFISLDQVFLILRETNKLIMRENLRLLEFISGALGFVID